MTDTDLLLHISWHRIHRLLLVFLASLRSYWLMHFDTNAPVLKSLNDRLRADPRVIKWTALKLGDRLDQITPKATSGGLDSSADAPEARALFGGKTMRYGWK